MSCIESFYTLACDHPEAPPPELAYNPGCKSCVISYIAAILSIDEKTTNVGGQAASVLGIEMGDYPHEYIVRLLAELHDLPLRPTRWTKDMKGTRLL